jgi:hypothetical protein
MNKTTGTNFNTLYLPSQVYNIFLNLSAIEITKVLVNSQVLIFNTCEGVASIILTASSSDTVFKKLGFKKVLLNRIMTNNTANNKKPVPITRLVEFNLEKCIIPNMIKKHTFKIAVAKKSILFFSSFKISHFYLFIYFVLAVFYFVVSVIAKSIRVSFRLCYFMKLIILSNLLLIINIS